MAALTSLWVQTARSQLEACCVVGWLHTTPCCANPAVLLQVGSYSAFFVRLLMFVSAPVTWPIGRLLDWLLGDEQTVRAGPRGQAGSASSCTAGSWQQRSVNIRGVAFWSASSVAPVAGRQRLARAPAAVPPLPHHAARCCVVLSARAAAADRPPQALFRRAQLKALVGLHSSAEGLGGNLSADEISIITGALDLTSKTAWTAMTPLDKVRGAGVVLKHCECA